MHLCADIVIAERTCIPDVLLFSVILLLGSKMVLARYIESTGIVK